MMQELTAYNISIADGTNILSPLPLVAGVSTVTSSVNRSQSDHSVSSGSMVKVGRKYQQKEDSHLESKSSVVAKPWNHSFQQQRRQAHPLPAKLHKSF